jgi:hypothetical protein
MKTTRYQNTVSGRYVDVPTGSDQEARLNLKLWQKVTPRSGTKPGTGASNS